MSENRRARRQEALEASFGGTGSGNRTRNHMFDWELFADRLLFSKKVDRNIPVADNTLLIRPIGIPFLDFKEIPRESTDPKLLRIARWQNESGEQWLASLSIEEKTNPILKVLHERGAFAVVGRGGNRRGVHQNKPWYTMISCDNSGIGSDGVPFAYGHGYRGQTQLLFQVLDRLDEDNRNRTKLVVRDPYIDANTAQLLWAMPGFASFMVEQAYLRLAAKGTKYEMWEDWDLLIARHPHFQEGNYGHFFGIAALVVEGNTDPHGSLKEDEELIELFGSLAPYVNNDPIEFDELDTIDLDPLFAVSELEPIFNHIKNVLKLVDKDLPGTLQAIAEALDLNVEDYTFVDISGVVETTTTTKTQSSEPQGKKPDESKAVESKGPKIIHPKALDKIADLVSGMEADGTLIYTEKFNKLKDVQKRSWPCDGCKAPIPAALLACPFCGKDL